MRLTITFSEAEIDRLQALAEREMRGLKEQVRFLVVKALATLETEGATAPALAGGEEASIEHA